MLVEGEGERKGGRDRGGRGMMCSVSRRGGRKEGREREKEEGG